MSLGIPAVPPDSRNSAGSAGSILTSASACADARGSRSSSSSRRRNRASGSGPSAPCTKHSSSAGFDAMTSAAIAVKSKPRAAAGTASALAPEISANWVISRLRCPGRASTGAAPIRCSAK